MSPKEIIDSGKMHPRQWLAVAIMIGLNALDGFDVLSSAFAGPGIKQEWQLGPDGLGIVLAMELIGMGVGSLLLGSMADKYGRRLTILACLALDGYRHVSGGGRSLSAIAVFVALYDRHRYRWNAHRNQRRDQ